MLLNYYSILTHCLGEPLAYLPVFFHVRRVAMSRMSRFWVKSCLAVVA